LKVSAVRHKCAFGLFAQLSLILVTKYRWKIFDAVVSSRAKKIFDRIAPHYKIECIEWSMESWQRSRSYSVQTVAVTNRSIKLSKGAC